MLTTSMKAIRQALRDQFGKRHYKITRTGDVHVYGPMPNSRIVGWWLMGDLITAELWLGLPANNSNKD